MPFGRQVSFRSFRIQERLVTHLAEQVNLRGEMLLALEMLLQPLMGCERFVALLAAVYFRPVQQAAHHILVGRRRQMFF